MKKVFLLILFCTFVSCDKYYKSSFVSTNAVMNKDYETEYCLRIFENYTLTNNGAIKIFILKDEQITEKNIDSINKEADKFIKLLNKKL